SGPGLQVARQGDAGALVFGRLRFADQAPGRQPSDAATELLARWREQGDAVLDALAGEWLVALWDGQGRALLAVDRFSTFPLFWAEQGGRLGFGARPADAAQAADLSLQADWQSVFAYTYCH